MTTCDCYSRIINKHEYPLDVANKNIRAGASIIIATQLVETPGGRVIVPVIVAGKERYGPNKGLLNIPCGRRQKTDCCGYGTAVRETNEEIKINITGYNNCFTHRGSFIIVTKSEVDIGEINKTLFNHLLRDDLTIDHKEMSECYLIVIQTQESINKFTANVNNQKYNKIDPPMGEFLIFVCNFLRKEENWNKYVKFLLS